MISTTSTFQLASFTPGAPPQSFPFSFNFEQTSEIYAVLYGTGLAGVTLVQGVDFTVATTPPAASGTINVIGPNWAGAYAAYGNIRIYRKTAIVNGTSVVNGGAIDANVLEFVIDELTQMMQEQGAGGIASIFDLTAPVTDPPGLNYILPSAAVRANTGLLFDANGNVVAGSPSAATINAALQAGFAAGLIPGVGVGLVSTSVSNSPAALSGNAFYVVNSAGATSQSFSAGATVAGIALAIYNAAAGVCSVVLSGGLTITLTQGQFLSARWNGSVWTPDAAPSRSYTTINSGSPYTFLATTSVLDVTTGAGNFVVNLFPASSVLPGTVIDIRKADSGAGKVQLTPNGSDTINGITGAAAWEITDQYGHVQLEAITGGWRIVSCEGTWYILNDTSTRTQSSPSASTWYNPGSLSLTLPPGVYELSYFAELSTISGASGYHASATLSTANNSQSDADFTTGIDGSVGTGTAAGGTSVSKTKKVYLAVSTAFYLNVGTNGSGYTSISFSGVAGPGGGGSTRIMAKRVA
ncbi:MAG: hypothetical protein ABSG17_11285 [Spirochaetia bacterium]|jgi:hypothetical protein